MLCYKSSNVFKRWSSRHHSYCTEWVTKDPLSSTNSRFSILVNWTHKPNHSKSWLEGFKTEIILKTDLDSQYLKSWRWKCWMAEKYFLHMFLFTIRKIILSLQKLWNFYRNICEIYFCLLIPEKRKVSSENIRNLISTNIAVLSHRLSHIVCLETCQIPTCSLWNQKVSKI